VIKPLLVTALTFAAASLTVTPIGWADEARAYSHQNKIEGAVAYFSQVDEAGIQTDVEVFALDDFNHDRGAPDFASAAEVRISRFDSACPFFVFGCPGAIINAITVDWVPLAPEDFRLTAVSDGASAELNTTVSVFDRVSNSPFDVSIRLKWRCIGPIDRSHVHPQDQSLMHVKTVGCSAEARGSVSDESTAFAADVTSDALMFLQTTGEVAAHL
jgi:hypothetical protein